jgi:hypothetical protein
MALPSVLIRIIDEYSPEFVQKFLEEDAKYNDIASARRHLTWCDPRHVHVEDLWKELEALTDVRPWLDLLRAVPDRIAEWQIQCLAMDQILDIWRSGIGWLSRNHVEQAFQNYLFSSRNKHRLDQFADIILPCRDVWTFERKLFDSLEMQTGTHHCAIMEWWARYSRRSVEAMANDHPIFAFDISRWTVLKIDRLNDEAKLAIEQRKNQRREGIDRHNRELLAPKKDSRKKGSRKKGSRKKR